VPERGAVGDHQCISRADIEIRLCPYWFSPRPGAVPPFPLFVPVPVIDRAVDIDRVQTPAAIHVNIGADQCVGSAADPRLKSGSHAIDPAVGGHIPSQDFIETLLLQVGGRFNKAGRCFSDSGGFRDIVVEAMCRRHRPLEDSVLHLTPRLSGNVAEDDHESRPANQSRRQSDEQQHFRANCQAYVLHIFWGPASPCGWKVPFLQASTVPTRSVTFAIPWLSR